MVYLQNGITMQELKKEGILTFYNSMDGTKDSTLSEISQSEKDKYYDLTYMCNLMNKIN